MKTITVKPNKLAIAVLAMSMTQAVNAMEDTTQTDSDNEGTYWGLSIGSILGGIIAGPPGIIIGATLGGTIGWGKDKDAALGESVLQLEEHELALEQSQQDLKHNRSRLNKARQKMSELSRSNALQSARLADLSVKGELTHEGGEGFQSRSTIDAFIGHYAQEVYFRHGESDVPDYAAIRLAKLTEFLKSQPNLQVKLKGYTDHLGADEFNIKLAQARVDGIREALIVQGLDSRRVSVEAVGEAQSQALVGDAGNYVLDRRVSIELSLNNLHGVQPIASIGEVIQ